MQFKTIPYEQMPGSRLFKSFISNFDSVKEFYSFNPHDEPSVTEFIEKTSWTGNRAHLIKALRSYAHKNGLSEKMHSNIEMLSSEQVFTITTGQQLSVFGGPLFTIYKTITAIQLARKWTNATGKTIVPVFWLADEDHDFDEAATCTIPEGNGFKTIRYDSQSGGSVGRIRFGAEINVLINELKSVLHETSFSEEVFHLISDCYASGETFRSAFAKLLDTLFAKEGLIIAGSDDEELKMLLVEPLCTAVQKANQVTNALELQSNALIERGFHAQAHVDASQLFYFHNGKRIKLSRTGDTWSCAGMTWSSETLCDEIKKKPYQFSPNVFLRPILQDVLLPNVAYVAGPGELAYYGQMKQMYPIFGLTMPIIQPRLSLTLLQPSQARNFDELGLELTDYFCRIEDLEASILEKMDKMAEWDGIFESWWEKLKAVSEGSVELIAAQDATLHSSAERLLTQTQNELEKLKGKVVRSIKQQEQVKLNRVRKLHQSIWPMGALQERTFPHIFMLNLWGMNFWSDILERTKSLTTNQHYIITL